MNLLQPGLPTMEAVAEAMERARQAKGAGLRELLDAADALVELHGAEPGAASTNHVAEAVNRLAAAVAAMREEQPRPPQPRPEGLGS